MQAVQKASKQQAWPHNLQVAQHVQQRKFKHTENTQKKVASKWDPKISEQKECGEGNSVFRTRRQTRQKNGKSPKKIYLGPQRQKNIPAKLWPNLGKS